MRDVRVMVFVDINASRDDVFTIIANCDRRLQLSPLWGVATLEDVSTDFPNEGSWYRVKIVQGDEQEYETIVTDYQPNQKFAYKLMVDRQTKVTWTVQDSAVGTRLTYIEEYLASESEDDEFDQSVQRVIKEWLDNIKRYAELRDTRVQRFAKWIMDRYYLKLRVDQRRVILAILVLQAMGCISFVIVAIGFGIVKLF